MWALLALFGLMSGFITTWIGLGGGVLLTLALATWLGPQTALAISSPALWVGNVHRLGIYWSALHRPSLLWLGLSGAAGGLAGGILTTDLPEQVLRLLLVLAPVLILVSSRVEIPPRVRRLVSVPFGAAAGMMSATSGGGGPLIGPVLLSWGLTAGAFIATSSAIALLTHTGRVVAYVLGGWLTPERWAMAAVLAVCLPLGNLLGRWLRARTHEALLDWGLRGAALVLAILVIANI